MAILSEDEKERIRYHLGYLNTDPAASITYGVPRPIQTLFLVEQAMSFVRESSFPRIRRILRIMDEIEDQLIESQIRLSATKLNGIDLRADESDRLEHEYVRWGKRLSDILGAPVYPYSDRYMRAGRIAAGNILIRHS